MRENFHRSSKRKESSREVRQTDRQIRENKSLMGGPLHVLLVLGVVGMSYASLNSGGRFESHQFYIHI